MPSVDCFKCKNLIITWDQSASKGCSVYGFKSNTLPSIVVENSSGIACESFEPKKESPALSTGDSKTYMR